MLNSFDYPPLCIRLISSHLRILGHWWIATYLRWLPFTMWYEGLMVLLDLAALACSGYGAYWNWKICQSPICYLFAGIFWYIISGIANLAGALDIIMNSWNCDVSVPRKNIYLQFHYFLGWLALIVGYPLFVSATWLHYFPTFTVHLHLLCIIIPLFVWAQASNALVAVSELCLVACLISHYYVSFASGNAWSLIGAMVMTSNIFFLCFSNHRMCFFGLKSREASIISGGVAYIILTKSVEAMVRYTAKC